ncbi:MAG: HAD-IB family hydrolase [Clostridia bacterium]|nr:HAD-IB family hydrolase [Clostridia bacterium]
MRKSFALFDFDGTMIPGDSLIRFCLYARRHGLVSHKQLWRGAWAALRYCLRLLSAVQSKTIALSFLAGTSQAELTALSQRFYQDVLRPLLRSQAIATLVKHRRDGLAVLLITASPSFYLEPLKAEYGIEAVIATRMDVDPDGFATGLICGENCKGLQKPLRLAEYLAATGDRLDYASSYAYGNSGGDFPMLALCGHKVAVNGSRRLAKKLKGETGTVSVRWNE